MQLRTILVEDKSGLQMIVSGSGEMNFTIRQEGKQDQDAVDRLHKSAFGGDLEAKLVSALREACFAKVSLVAAIQNEVVAHILFSSVAIRTASGSVDALSLAPLAVLPHQQRKGLGSEMTRTGLEFCKKRGDRIVVVLGHPDFYSRFGFSAELARQLESPFGGGDAWMALELVPQALCGIHGAVEYSPPFSMFC